MERSCEKDKSQILEILIVRAVAGLVAGTVVGLISDQRDKNWVENVKDPPVRCL